MLPLIRYFGYSETSVGTTTVTSGTAYAWFIQLRYRSSDLSPITTSTADTVTVTTANSTSSPTISLSTKSNSNTLALGLGLGLGLPLDLTLLSLLFFLLRELRRHNRILQARGNTVGNVRVAPEDETAAPGINVHEIAIRRGRYELQQGREAHELPQDGQAHELPQGRA